jgi:hypothetical protein
LVFTIEAPEDAEVVGVGVEIKQLHPGNVLEQVQYVLIEIRTAQIGSAILDDETDKPAKTGIRKF